MTIAIRSPKEFWTGVIYVAIGASAIFIASDYGMGTAVRMGPGYFPIVLGGILALIGAVALVRAFILPGEPIGGIAIKAIVLVLGAVLLIAFLIRGAGVLVTLPLLVMITAYASSKFRWLPALALAAGLTVFCSLVFVKALGIPLPLIGSWFGG